MLVAEERQYDYLYQEPVTKPKSKPKRRTKSQNKMKRKKKVKYLTFTAIGFLMALFILFQYTQLSAVNQEILTLENQLEEVNKLSDSMEGEILVSEDLKKIEKIAKEELGMIEPSAKQMTTIEIQKNHENTMELATADINNTSNSPALLESLSKVLNFID